VKPDPEAFDRRFRFHEEITRIAQDNKATEVIREGGNVVIKTRAKNLIVPIPGGIVDQPLFPTEFEASTDARDVVPLVSRDVDCFQAKSQ